MPERRWIRTEIEINAPYAVVWKVVADFPGYGSWNPFIRRISGDLTVGERPGKFVRLPWGLPMALWPRILEVEAGRRLKWLGSLMLPGLLDGEHLFMIEPLTEAKVRFIQAETFSGVLLNVLWHWLKQQGREAFEMMNKALKLTAERISECSS